MSYVDLTLTTKGDIKIEHSYNGKIQIAIDNVDIDDVISEIGISNLLSCMDIDEVISELEEKGYTVEG